LRDTNPGTEQDTNELAQALMQLTTAIIDQIPNDSTPDVGYGNDRSSMSESSETDAHDIHIALEFKSRTGCLDDYLVNLYLHEGATLNEAVALYFEEEGYPLQSKLLSEVL
jgi:hypothetical protein